MDKIYKFGEFARAINVSLSTLKRWDNENILIALRTPTDRRFYSHQQYLDYIKGKENAKGIHKKIHD